MEWGCQGYRLGAGVPNRIDNLLREETGIGHVLGEFTSSVSERLFLSCV